MYVAIHIDFDSEIPSDSISEYLFFKNFLGDMPPDLLEHVIIPRSPSLPYALIIPFSLQYSVTSHFDPPWPKS